MEMTANANNTTADMKGHIELFSRSSWTLSSTPVKETFVYCEK